MSVSLSGPCIWYLLLLFQPLKWFSFGWVSNLIASIMSRNLHKFNLKICHMSKCRAVQPTVGQLKSLQDTHQNYHEKLKPKPSQRMLCSPTPLNILECISGPSISRVKHQISQVCACLASFQLIKVHPSYNTFAFREIWCPTLGYFL